LEIIKNETTTNLKKKPNEKRERERDLYKRIATLAV